MAAAKNSKPRITNQRVIGAGARSSHFLSARASLRSSLRMLSIGFPPKFRAPSRFRDGAPFNDCEQAGTGTDTQSVKVPARFPHAREKVKVTRLVYPRSTNPSNRRRLSEPA